MAEQLISLARAELAAMQPQERRSYARALAGRVQDAVERQRLLRDLGYSYHQITVAVALSRGVPVVVCGQKPGDTERFRRDHALPTREVVHAGRPETLRGLSDFEVVRLPGFWDRSDAHDVWTEVLARRARNGR